MGAKMGALPSVLLRPPSPFCYTTHYPDDVGVFKFMESWSNTNCLVLRRDLKPTALCELEDIGRKANTARAGPGKISVRKFMQGKFLPPFSYTTLTPRYSWRGFLNLWRFGATSTAWYCVGILSPQRCVSLRPQAERRTPRGRACFKLNISASPKCFY